MQHGGFYFNKPALVEELPYGGNNLAARLEDFFDLGVGDKVQVALAVALVDITEPVPFLGQGLKRFRQQGEVLYFNGGFAASGTDELAADPDNIADVYLLK